MERKPPGGLPQKVEIGGKRKDNQADLGAEALRGRANTHPDGRPTPQPGGADSPHQYRRRGGERAELQYLGIQIIKP